MYKIMLVEDEQLVRESMAQNIDWNTLGFSAPSVCANGQEAMEQIEHKCPDVVITDICMPFVDGLELSAYIREHFPDTVIVILTGFSEFAYAQKAIEYRIHNYLLKPISPDEFQRMLKNIAQGLDRKQNEKRFYHRAKNANDALKYHFFQNLLYQNPMQNFREQADTADVTFAGSVHTAALVQGEVGRQTLETLCHNAAPMQYRILDTYTLMIFDGEETAELRSRSIAACRSLVQDRNERVLVGLSGICRDIDQIPAMVGQARHALGYAFTTGHKLLLDSELVRIGGSLHTEACPSAAEIAKLVHDGNGSRALEQLGQLFRQMQIKQVHLDECNAVLEQLRLFLLSELNRDQQHLTPSVMQAEPGDTIGQVQLAYERLISYLLQHTSSALDSPSTVCVRRAIDYIEQNYGNCDLMLADLLGYLSVSRSYFSSIFKTETGQSFSSYLNDVRMKKASELLRHTGLCSYEIAERIGFSDPHYFSVTFKRCFGMTPKQYREANG